jgi:hypothetical protein
LVAILDDFNAILSLDFLKKTKITIIPYFNGILIANKLCPSFVSCYKALVAKYKKSGNNMILTTVIDKALRKGEEVFLVSITHDGELG